MKTEEMPLQAKKKQKKKTTATPAVKPVAVVVPTIFEMVPATETLPEVKVVSVKKARAPRRSATAVKPAGKADADADSEQNCSVCKKVLRFVSVVCQHTAVGLFTFAAMLSCVMTPIMLTHVAISTVTLAPLGQELVTACVRWMLAIVMTFMLGGTLEFYKVTNYIKLKDVAHLLWAKVKNFKLKPGADTDTNEE